MNRLLHVKASGSVFLLSACFLAGCKDNAFSLRLPYDQALVVLVADDASQLSFEHVQSGEAVSLVTPGSEFHAFIIPDEMYLSPEGEPANLEEVAAYLTTRRAQSGRCGFCPSARTEPPFVASPGSDCAVPAAVPVFVGPDPATGPDVERLRSSIRLAWPGACPCDAERTPVARGPVRPLTGDWPARFALNLPSGETLLLGRRVVRTSSAGTVRDGPVSAPDVCGPGPQTGGIEARLRAVSVVGPNRVLAFARGDGEEDLVLDVDTSSLEVTHQPWRGPEFYAYDSVEIDGEWVLVGNGRVEAFSTGVVSACELSGGAPSCRAVATHGGISTDIERVARIGSGLAFATRETVVAMPRWPKVAEVSVVATLNDASDRLNLSDGSSLPAWVYTPSSELRWQIGALAEGTDAAVVCGGDSGLEIFVIPMGSQASRPELIVGDQCPALHCSALVHAWGRAVLIARDDQGQSHLFEVDEQGRLGGSCEGRILPGLSGGVVAHADAGHLTLVDDQRQVVRLASVVAEPEWIVRSAKSPVVRLEKTNGDAYAYRSDGTVQRLRPSGPEPIGQLAIEGDLIAASMSSRGELIFAARRSSDIQIGFASFASGTLRAFPERDLSIAHSNSATELLWIGPDRAIVRTGNKLYLFEGDGILPMEINWDDPGTPAVEDRTPGSIRWLFGDAGEVTMLGSFSLALRADPWSEPPRAARVSVRLEQGMVDIDDTSLAGRSFGSPAEICPGRFRIGTGDRETFTAYHGLSGDLIIRSTGVLPGVGLQLEDLSEGVADPEAVFSLESLGVASGGMLARGQGVEGLDVPMIRLVATEEALYALGDDGRIYVSAPCP